jgi:hypothetical protein
MTAGAVDVPVEQDERGGQDEERDHEREQLVAQTGVGLESCGAGQGVLERLAGAGGDRDRHGRARGDREDEPSEAPPRTGPYGDGDHPESRQRNEHDYRVNHQDVRGQPEEEQRHDHQTLSVAPPVCWRR